MESDDLTVVGANFISCKLLRKKFNEFEKNSVCAGPTGKPPRSATRTSINKNEILHGQIN